MDTKGRKERSRSKKGFRKVQAWAEALELSQADLERFRQLPADDQQLMMERAGGLERLSERQNKVYVLEQLDAPAERHELDADLAKPCASLGADAAATDQLRGLTQPQQKTAMRHLVACETKRAGKPRPAAVPATHLSLFPPRRAPAPADLAASTRSTSF